VLKFKDKSFRLCHEENFSFFSKQTDWILWSWSWSALLRLGPTALLVTAQGTSLRLFSSGVAQWQLHNTISSRQKWVISYTNYNMQKSVHVINMSWAWRNHLYYIKLTAWLASASINTVLQKTLWKLSLCTHTQTFKRPSHTDAWHIGFGTCILTLDVR